MNKNIPNAMFHKDIIDQQVDDLRERMRLLQQDRRANVDILEASKSTNAEEIRILRDEHKILRLKLSQLKKTPDLSIGGPQDISALKKGVISLRTDFDSLRVSSGKHQIELNKLKDELKLCELEARQPSQEDSSLSRRICTLENRLDKAVIKYNEAQSIKNTYEHIFKRLNNERFSFDNQLKALERTLYSKKRDYEELLLLAGDANHAKEMASKELQSSRIKFEDSRLERESRIRERHQIVKIRKQFFDRQERRKYKRNELSEKLNLKHNVDSKIISSISFVPEHVNTIRSTIEEDTNELEIYEIAFRKIKDATGVSDVNEVIRKIIGQENTTEILSSSTKQNQAKTNQLFSIIDQLRKSVENTKYSSKNIGEGKKLVEERELKLMHELSNLEEYKSKHERYAKILINVSAGIRHLQNKTEGINNELGKTKVAFTERSVVNVLNSSGDALVEVLSKINRSQYKKETFLQKNSCSNFIMFDALEMLNEEDMQENRPFNQRVLLPSVKADLMDGSGHFEDGFDDIDEEEISRDKVKKNSSQILQTQERRKRREKRQARCNSQGCS